MTEATISPIEVHRNCGHPWNQKDTQWDRMHITAVDEPHLDRLLLAADRKFWRTWFVDRPGLTAVLYKPSGQDGAWNEDRMKWLNDGDLAAEVGLGDIVYTESARGITRHRIVEEKAHVACATGRMLRVSPPSPGCASNQWIDSGWFRRVQ